MKINKSTVEKLPCPAIGPSGATGQKRYYDEKTKGFGVRVTSGGTKAFFLEKLVNRKLRRITLGRYPELNAEQARREAQKILGKIATGIDPVAEKKEQAAKSVTLSQAFDDYLNARKNLKPTTIKDYKRIMHEAFPDWQNKPMLDISKEMIAKRHTKFGERSHARSNLSMRLLRALFNFAAGEYEDAKGRSLILENPVKRLSHTRAWYRIDRRQTVIKATDLPGWYKAVTTLHETHHHSKANVIRDYLLLILFTGLRRQEAATLTWSDVDFDMKTITISNTKNNLPHTLPLSDFLYELLKNRLKDSESEFVFPGSGKSGHIVEPRKIMEKITDASGVVFTLHCLRRTFITCAESLDIPMYALKKLLNHKMSTDVTSGYIVIDAERLRGPMQRITDYLLETMESQPAQKVTLQESPRHRTPI